MDVWDELQHADKLTAANYRSNGNGTGEKMGELAYLLCVCEDATR
jgi:hypothetical protein